MYRGDSDDLGSIKKLKCCEVPTHEGAPPLTSTGGCGGGWELVFDAAGWANCSSTTCAMAGLTRGDSAETLVKLEGAVCVPSGGPSVSCHDVDIASAFDSANWVICADGEYMNGLYRVSNDNNLRDVDSMRCCKGNAADTWSNCEDYSIASAFDIASTDSYPGARDCAPSVCTYSASPRVTSLPRARTRSRLELAVTWA